MMQFLRDWLLGVTGAALALAVLKTLVPRGSVSKVCALAGGLAVLFAALQPIVSLDGDALAEAAAAYQTQREEFEETLQENQDAVLGRVIESRAAAYVADKAAEMGISCQAEVTVSDDENGVPVPWAVSAWADWAPGQQEALGEMLERDLGIPPQRQSFMERDE